MDERGSAGSTEGLGCSSRLDTPICKGSPSSSFCLYHHMITVHICATRPAGFNRVWPGKWPEIYHLVENGPELRQVMTNRMVCAPPAKCGLIVAEKHLDAGCKLIPSPTKNATLPSKLGLNYNFNHRSRYKNELRQNNNPSIYS